MSTTAAATHIVIDEKGRAWIEGTGTKVVQVVMDKLAWGWDAGQIHRQYPHLPLAKIHATLSYYYDHKDEIDAEVGRIDREAKAMRAAARVPGPRLAKPEEAGEFVKQVVVEIGADDTASAGK